MDHSVVDGDLAVRVEIPNDGTIGGVGVKTTNSDSDRPLTANSDRIGSDTRLDLVTLVQHDKLVDVGGGVESDENDGFALRTDGDAGEVVVPDVEFVEKPLGLLLTEVKVGVGVLLQPDLDHLLLVSLRDVHGRDSRPRTCWPTWPSSTPTHC